MAFIGDGLERVTGAGTDELRVTGRQIRGNGKGGPCDTTPTGSGRARLPM